MGFFSSISKVYDPFGIIAGVTGQTSADAAKRAAKTQAKSYEGAIGEQARQFDTMLELTAPWRQAGTQALGTYQNALQNPTQSYNAFTKTPAYTMPLAEGQRAIDRSAAARGNLLSGGTLRAATRYGENYASGQYGNYLDRLAGLSGVGYGASSQAGQNALQTGTNVGNLLIGQGNARASGYTNAANAKQQGITNLLQLVGFASGFNA